MATKQQSRISVDFRTPRSRSCTAAKTILSIIEGVENRCMAADGPVTPTSREINEDEIREIYFLARQDCSSFERLNGDKEKETAN
jgi:hypothetical protein